MIYFLSKIIKLIFKIIIVVVSFQFKRIKNTLTTYDIISKTNYETGESKIVYEKKKILILPSIFGAIFFSLFFYVAFIFFQNNSSVKTTYSVVKEDIQKVYSFVSDDKLKENKTPRQSSKFANSGLYIKSHSKNN
jgi:hypothetical protein